MEILLFNFSKRKNSTKRPVDSDGVSKQVTLKGECSYINPSFFLGDVTGYTYLKAWGNYYFIDRVAYDINGAQYINCSIDVLATWKSQILASRAFVEYSSSNYSPNLIDSRVSQLVTRERSKNVEPSMFVKDFNEGCYIISTANAHNGVCSYIVSRENMELLIGDLLYESPTEIDNWEELFGDAMGSIISVRYVPITYSHFDTSSQEDMILGNWNSGYPGILHKGNIGENRTISIPWRYTDFRRSSDFTRFSLALPFIGVVDILPESLIDYDNITIQMVGNCVTGNIAYNIMVGSPTVDKILATYTGTFGMQVPVAQGQVDLNGILSSGVAAGGAWAGAMLGLSSGAAAGVMVGSAIKAIVSANMSDYTIIGGFSGGYGEVMIRNYELTGISVDSRTDPTSLTELYGRPCMQVQILSELTGFVKTNGFSIDISAISEVKDMINQAMDKGVYIE